MIRTIKWIFLFVLCGVIAGILYTKIDSDWAADNNLSMLMTIGFFAAATPAILCVFNAVEAKDTTLKH